MSTNPISAKAPCLLEKPLKFYHAEIKKTFHKLPEKGIAAELARRVVFIVMAPLAYLVLGLTALIGKAFSACTNAKKTNTPPQLPYFLNPPASNTPLPIFSWHLDRIFDNYGRPFVNVWPIMQVEFVKDGKTSIINVNTLTFKDISPDKLKEALIQNLENDDQFKTCSKWTLDLKFIFLTEGNLLVRDILHRSCEFDEKGIQIDMQSSADLTPGMTEEDLNVYLNKSVFRNENGDYIHYMKNNEFRPMTDEIMSNSDVLKQRETELAAVKF